MSEPTPDDKIARLVHLVLEAVDQRLEGLRQELQQLHHRLAEVEKAVAGAPTARASVAAGPDPRVDRISDEIRSIRTQLEALAQRPAAAPAVSPVMPAMPSSAAAPVSPAPAIAPIAPSAPHGNGHSVDTSLPTLQPLLPTAAPALSSTDSTGSMPRPMEPLSVTTGEHPELIDLDRLNDLLTAKLGQLNLPKAN